MMTSHKESGDVIEQREVKMETKEPYRELTDLPPSGTSLHKRRRGEPPASLSVRTPNTPSDVEGSSPCTAGPTSDNWSPNDVDARNPRILCDNMLQRLKDRQDLPSKRGVEVALQTKDTLDAFDQLEKLLDLLDQFVTLKEHNERLLRKLKDVNHLKRLHDAHKALNRENERLKAEKIDVQLFMNEALEAEFESDQSQAIFDSIYTGARGMKRSGSKWRGHSKFGGSLLRKQRSRSAGGDDSDVTPDTPLRRRSEGIFSKEVEKSKVSKWTKVKAAFRWEKAQWPQAAIGVAAGPVAVGAMAGAVALAGSNPVSGLVNLETKDSASLTPGSAISLTPNSSCEELRIETGKPALRCDDNDNTFLHAPTQDDSSTSPSPNKLHKSPWGKMRDIITHGSVRKKSSRVVKNSPDVVPIRRRSLSDGGDSDAPPALTLTIPSSEELESDSAHPLLRKQRSLELGARLPQHRPPRASKWTKVKRAFLTSASASVPSSPNRHSAFFTDAGMIPNTKAAIDCSGKQHLPTKASLRSAVPMVLHDRSDRIVAAVGAGTSQLNYCLRQGSVHVEDNDVILWLLLKEEEDDD